MGVSSIEETWEKDSSDSPAGLGSNVRARWRTQETALALFFQQGMRAKKRQHGESQDTDAFNL